MHSVIYQRLVEVSGHNNSSSSRGHHGGHRMFSLLCVLLLMAYPWRISASAASSSDSITFTDSNNQNHQGVDSTTTVNATLQPPKLPPLPTVASIASAASSSAKIIESEDVTGIARLKEAIRKLSQIIIANVFQVRKSKSRNLFIISIIIKRLSKFNIRFRSRIIPGRRNAYGRRPFYGCTNDEKTEATWPPWRPHVRRTPNRMS